MEEALDIKGLLRAILTCVTAGPGLGFNRAAVFLADDAETRLEAALAVGPASTEEAYTTWARLARESPSLDDLLRRPSDPRPGGFQGQVEGIVTPIRFASASETTDALSEAYWYRRVVHLSGRERLPPSVSEVFEDSEIVCVPLASGDRALGVLIADNAITRLPIEAERVRLLQLLAMLAGMALENARMSRRAERQSADLRRALEQLRSAQDQLLHKERLATIGEVAANVSHEIRNPLATIGGFARVLANHPDDSARVARNAAIIVEEVQNLEALLKEMLDFTSPRPPMFQRTDVAYLITSLASRLEPELADSGVELELEIEGDCPAAFADSGQLQRLVLNLWRNALEALEESVPPQDKRLGIRVRPVGERVAITISNSGAPIARDVLPHLFTPFFTTKRRGTGLGLAVVKKIVDDHHGEIRVDSEPSRGTAFTVTLPQAR